VVGQSYGGKNISMSTSDVLIDGEGPGEGPGEGVEFRELAKIIMVWVIINITAKIISTVFIY
tara:strand:+ start:320 stop:505 length:186 start_codon:yes stop_codon:yes gene_type:complete